MEYIVASIKDFTNDEILNFSKKIKNHKKTQLTNMNKKRFKQAVIGEILLQKLLTKKNIKYEDIIIKKNKNGKPYITNYPIHYNISHDNDLVVCVINDFPIGVDILKIKKIDLQSDKFFCNFEESKYIKDINKFFEIFTLKEAYLKCLGLRISDIQNVVVIKNNKISLEEQYKYKKIIKDNYIISICYKEDN